MKLSLLSGTFAICRFAPDTAVPPWAWHDRTLLTITYTADELSLVCSSVNVPADVPCERPWSALKVEGPLDFALTGILSALVAPLAQAVIPIFAISTFNTDYLLIKESDMARACQVLEEFGHTFN
jgi:uncharacterized protein